MGLLKLFGHDIAGRPLLMAGIMLLLMGGVVLFIVMAILLPMLSMNQLV